ncbi:uncharacterized protein LOC144918205 [Branchiostoma floridae x Branchiostoma belcheri]
MEVVKTRKRKGNQFAPNGVKKRPLSPQTKDDSLKSELVTLNYRDPIKLKAFVKKHGSTSIMFSDGKMFTPWQGGSSYMYRLSECCKLYVNPPQDLKVIGYLGHIEEDIVIMVGTQSGKVYMDEDEILYIVADSVSEFAKHGCKKDPEFYDYYMSRPNDEKSLPCAAGILTEEEGIRMDIKEDLNIDYETLEADIEKVDQLFATGRYFNIPG